MGDTRESMAVIHVPAELIAIYEMCTFEVESQQFSELINAELDFSVSLGLDLAWHGMLKKQG